MAPLEVFNHHDDDIDDDGNVDVKSGMRYVVSG